jgi:glycosyltransferase involved in cell wall biosynthesis
MTALVARWAGSPTVVCSCHGWSLERPAAFDLQDAIAFSVCDAVTTPSTHWARVLTERAGLDDVPIVPYGFDLRRYPHVARATASNRPIRIVCVGELTDRKGPDVVLEAMAILWQQHPDVELHFIGGGDRAEHVRAQARTIDPSGSRVVLHGQMTAPYLMLAGFDLFALASRSDNQPVAIVEAMLAGVPVVSTRVGGIAEMVEGGQCGFAVEPNAPGPLAAALGGLITAGVEFRRALGERGERFARRTFDVEHHVDALEDVYRRARRSRQAA